MAQSIGKSSGCAVGLCLFLSLLFSQNLMAAGLLDVYRLAQENDPTIKSSFFQTSAIKEGRRQALAQMLPTLAGSAEYIKTWQDIISSDNEVYGMGSTNFDTQSYSLTLTQPVFRWDLFVGYQQTQAENLRAEAEYRLAVQDLLVRVADLYLQALAAGDQLTFARAEEAAVTKHYELASGRFEMGLVPISDLHDAKARLASVQAQTIEAENVLKDALQALQEVTGVLVEKLKPLQAEITLSDPAPLDMESWIEGALQQNPAIELQQQAVEVAEMEVSRQRAGHYPTLDLVGRYNYQNTDGTLFGGGSEVETEDILLQLNVPLYQGGLVSSRVREAKHLLSAARQNLVRQNRFVERQTRSAFLGVKSSLKRADALEQSVVSNQLALEAKQEGFFSGLFTSLAVLDAERDLYLAKQDYAQARYDYLLNSLKLKQAAGTLSEVDLVQLDQWFE